MPQHPRTALFLLLYAMLCLALPGCTTTVTRDRLIATPIPAPLLACQDAPSVPDSTTATQRDVGAFLALLYGAWGDCHDNLDAVRGLVAQQKAALDKAAR